MATRKTPKPRTPRDLTPGEFENLIFDLLVSRGMVNVVWRTPGADGGRDIEAMTVQTDFAGVQTLSKWFVECKRYAGSVDWPTIYGKLAYADSLQAEYLLMCTTSKFTPAAATQAEAWNAARRFPKIRLWPVQELDVQLKQHPDLTLKYGLSPASSTPGKSIVNLALALSKSVASYYSELVFQGAKPSLMLQAAQALSELLLRRMEEVSEAGSISPSYASLDGKALDGCIVKGVVQGVDEVGLRTFVAYLIALSNGPVEVIARHKGECDLLAVTEVSGLLTRYRDAFSAISLWSEFEFSFSGKLVHVRQR